MPQGGHPGQRPLMSPERAILLLASIIADGKDLLELPWNAPKRDQWTERARAALERAFAPGSSIFQNFGRAQSIVFSASASDKEMQEKVNSNVASTVSVLENAIEQLNWDIEERDSATKTETKQDFPSIPDGGSLSQTSTEPKLRIFLCHSSDDKPAVRNLYRALRSDGFFPWLDEETLLPGQDWHYEIRMAVRNSDAVIVCLSKTSISKSGFIQKEIKYALDIAEEQPPGTIFVIPLKLEECEIPEQLAKWQWINYFERGSYEKLTKALEILEGSKGKARSNKTTKSNQTGSPKTLSAKAYAIISLVGISIGIAQLLFYIYEVPRIVENGVRNQIFYILLIPWALSCAAFLFGAIRSFARFSHKSAGGTLELSGPVVVFFLVLWGGFHLVPSMEVFDLTVRAHSETVPMITSGRITIEFGNTRRTESIGASGEANFKSIPQRFLAQPIRFLPEIDNYKQQWQQYTPQDRVVELLVEAVVPSPREPSKAGPLARHLLHGGVVALEWSRDIPTAVWETGSLYRVWYTNGSRTWWAIGKLNAQNGGGYRIGSDGATTCPQSPVLVGSHPIATCFSPEDYKIVIWQGGYDFDERGNVLQGNGIVGHITALNSEPQ